MRFRHIAPAALAALVLACALPSVAQEPPKARFSDVLSFTGAPNLPLTISVVTAGGGAKDFSAPKLVGVLAGPLTTAEVDKLTKQYGADTVKSFLTVFTFVIDDALTIATEKKVALTATADPSPSDGKALSAALYKAGISKDGTYDVEYMLDALVSHPIHVQVMDDIDSKYGRKADANYHIVLTQAMTDLKAAYAL